MPNINMISGDDELAMMVSCDNNVPGRNLFEEIDELKNEGINSNAMSRYVVKLVKSGGNFVVQNYESSKTMSFNELKTAIKDVKNYVVCVYGNSKMRPQYVSDTEIMFIGLDRASAESKVLRLLVTPTTTTYTTYPIMEKSDVDPDENLLLPASIMTLEVGASADIIVYYPASKVSSYQWQYSANEGANWYNSSLDSANTNTLTIMGATRANVDGRIFRCKIVTTAGKTVFSGYTKVILSTALQDLDNRISALESGDGVTKEDLSTKTAKTLCDWLTAHVVMDVPNADGLYALLTGGSVPDTPTDPVDPTPDDPNPPSEDIYYTVTTNLTNCAISNKVTKVKDGQPFTATVTADDGYTLDTVTCTVGGVEQTVVDGVISIGAVYGEIVIVATGIKAKTVVPLTSIPNIKYTAQDESGSTVHDKSSTPCVILYSDQLDTETDLTVTATPTESFNALRGQPWVFGEIDGDSTPANGMVIKNAVVKNQSETIRYPDSKTYTYTVHAGKRFVFAVSNASALKDYVLVEG